MSDMKLIMENWRQHLQEAPFTDQVAGADIEKDLKQAAGKAAIAKAQGTDIQIQTVGDLKKMVAKAVRAKRTGNTASTALDFLKGLPLGILGPGKDLFDIAAAAYKLPDEKALGPGLKALNVDDEVSAIVDDQLENAFLKTLDKELSSGGIPDDTPLEKFDMTNLLSKYIANTHDSRTVTTVKKK